MEEKCGSRVRTRGKMISLAKSQPFAARFFVGISPRFDEGRNLSYLREPRKKSQDERVSFVLFGTE